MKIERHIYGSVHGYETLARSSGITDADAKVLEGVSAGAPANAALLGALRASPAYVVSSLGQYRALTRISEGLPDDQGRPTLRQVTLALAKPDWNGVLRGDILWLARRQDVWEWNGESVVQPHEIGAAGSTRAVAPPGSVDKILAILSLLERASSTGRPVLVRQEDLTLDEFALIERLLPPAARGSLTLAYRGFGTGLRASLICLAHESSGMQRDGLYRPGQLVELSPYAAALAQAGFKLGHIPEEFVRSYSGFGKSSKSQVSAPLPGSRLSPADFPSQVIVTRTPAGLVTGFMVACILLPVIAGFVTWWLTKRSAEQVRHTEVAAVDDKYAREIEERDGKLRAARESGENYAKEVEALRKTVQEKAKDITNMRQDILSCIQGVQLPILDPERRKAIVDLYRGIAERLPEDANEGKVARAKAEGLRQQSVAMGEAEEPFLIRADKPDGVGKIAETLSDLQKDNPVVQPAYKGLDAIFRKLVRSSPVVSTTYSLDRPGIAAAAGSDNRPRSVDPPSVPPASSQKSESIGEKAHIQKPAEVKAPQREPDFQVMVSTLEQFADSLGQVMFLLNRVKASLDDAKKSIQSINDGRDKRPPDVKRKAAEIALTHAVSMLEQWKKLLQNDKQDSLVSERIRVAVERIRTCLSSDIKLAVEVDTK